MEGVLDMDLPYGCTLCPRRFKDHGPATTHGKDCHKNLKKHLYFCPDKDCSKVVSTGKKEHHVHEELGAPVYMH